MALLKGERKKNETVLRSSSSTVEGGKEKNLRVKGGKSISPVW